MNETKQGAEFAGSKAPDWGVGRYESIAPQLLPAACVVVDAAELRPGERVLDIGCGTGNAALLAVDHGADVVGVDPAARLLDVARRRAADEGKQVTFERGDAASLPIADASVDVALSVFGVIFAPDSYEAAAEIARVVAPTGRVILSAWKPGGTMAAMNAAATEAVRNAIGAPPPPEPFPWHDGDALSVLFSPHGFSIDVAEHELAFTASSAQEHLDNESASHPLAVAGYRILEQLGQAEAVRARLLRILEDGNETHNGFRATSRYVVAVARR